VSPAFDETSAMIARHRKVHAALAEQLAGPIHALSIVAKTPQQWQAMLEQGKGIEPSPPCRGGDGSLPSR
jgi:BolA-like protein 1